MQHLLLTYTLPNIMKIAVSVSVSNLVIHQLFVYRSFFVSLIYCLWLLFVSLSITHSFLKLTFYFFHSVCLLLTQLSSLFIHFQISSLLSELFSLCHLLPFVYSYNHSLFNYDTIFSLILTNSVNLLITQPLPLTFQSFTVTSNHLSAIIC